MQREFISKSVDDIIRSGTWVSEKWPHLQTALVGCPKCGEAGSLAQHKIADDGMVTPSVVCPNDCGFHEYVKLDGWKQADGAY